MNRRNFLKSSVLIPAAGIVLSKTDFLSGMVNRFSDDYEKKLVEKILDGFETGYKSKSIGEVISYAGKKLLDTEYVAGTLDDYEGAEKLVIRISGLDCVTFVENTLTFARLIKQEKLSYDDYKNELQLIRYRNGKIDGYPSRLHYFTDWIYDNESKGIVKDITRQIGGKKYDKDINFMSTHTSSYRQLKNNQSYIADIKSVENSMSERQLYYIPKSKVNEYYDSLATGDIITTTTDIAGLDVTHTGFIYKEDGYTYFMHASIKSMKVIISNEELKEYLSSNKKQTGIIVARPQEV